MQLTTLMEILEAEIGTSPSARSTLAVLVAERSQKDKAAKARARATDPATDAVRRERRAVRTG